VETRLVAISTFSEVPKFFNHFEKAKTVLNEVLQMPALANSPPLLQALIHQQAAKLARLENQHFKEILHLKKLIEIEPSLPFAEDARNRLQELKQRENK